MVVEVSGRRTQVGAAFFIIDENLPRKCTIQCGGGGTAVSIVVATLNGNPDFGQRCHGRSGMGSPAGPPPRSIVITSWGPCIVPSNCPGDVNHTGVVNIDDLVMVIVNWG